MQLKPNTFSMGAYGCILGAFIGDSCGSYLEFIEYLPSDKEMNKCMGMPGGGMFGVGAGQVTDDSEMAMSLMWGLINSNYKSSEGEESK